MHSHHRSRSACDTHAPRPLLMCCVQMIGPSPTGQSYMMYAHSSVVPYLPMLPAGLLAAIKETQVFGMQRSLLLKGLAAELVPAAAVLIGLAADLLLHLMGTGKPGRYIP
jgi:hypothetical protein